MTYTSIYAKPLTDAERERYRRFVASLPCALCAAPATQCAHYSGEYAHMLGKGVARKCHDLATWPLCPTCHADYDQHRMPDIDAWALAKILETLTKAADAGVFRIPKEVA